MNPNNLARLKLAQERKAEQQRRSIEHVQNLESMNSLQETIFKSFQAVVSALEGNSSKAEAISAVVDTLEALENKVDKNKETVGVDIALLKSGLETLKKELTTIPVKSLKALPRFLQQKEQIKVTNLGELQQYFTTLEKAINQLKGSLVVEAPKVDVKIPDVNVPAPIVNVDAPDLKPLIKPLESLLPAIKGIINAIPQPLDLSGIEKRLDKQNKLLKEIWDKPSGGSASGSGLSRPYLSKTIDTGQVTVSTTATLILAANGERHDATLVNLGTTDVYIGDSEVTTSTGVLLLGTKGTALTLNTRAAIYAIVGSGTQAISYIEENY